MRGYLMRTIRADEYCKFVTDGTHDSPKQVDKGKKLITSKHLGRYGINFEGAKNISELDYQKVISRSKVEQWDILFSMIGTIGNLYLERNHKIEYACKNMGIFQLGGDESKAKWLYYYLQTPKAKEYIETSGRGTTQSYVPLAALRALPVDVVDDFTRDKIIKILWDIDEKILTNQQVNENLSDLLQSIYQAQFGDVSLVANKGILSDICSYSKEKVAVSDLNVNIYFSTENMLPGKAGSTEATSLPATPQTTACRKGDTLISNIRPYFKKIVYCEDMCGCSTDVLCFTPVQSQYAAYLFSTLYTDKFFAFMVAGSKGTKMPRGDKQQIMTYPVVLPTENELKEFNAIAFPVLDQINSNKAENKRLSALRDALLPKLMSDEIDVSDIDI